MAMGPLPTLHRSAPPEGWAGWLDSFLDRLIQAFGPAYWWPSVTAPPPAKAAPFEMITGAILVQNVAWTNTEKALRALDEAGLLHLTTFDQALASEIEPLVRPAGFFRQKSQRLKSFVAFVMAEYGGDLAALLEQPLPKLRAELLAQPGIGPETADCILCYAAGQPVMAMDGYTRRIFTRLGLFDPRVSYDQMQAFFHRYLPEEAEVRGEYHAQLVVLGNRFCHKSRPRCSLCPVVDRCQRVGVERDGGAGEG